MILEIQIILKRIAAEKPTEGTSRSGKKKDSRIETYHLMRMLNQREVKIGRNWQEIYPVAVDLGLIKEEGKWTKLTEKGQTFESMIEDSSTFTIAQKRFLLKNCILRNIPEFSTINQFLINTELNGPEGFEIFYEDSNLLEQFSKRDLGVISELGLRKNDNNAKKYVIPEDFADIVDDYKEGNDDEMSEPDFDKIHQEQKDVGERAEQLAVCYEREFLSDHGTSEQVKKFNELNSPNNIIAKRNIRAGYDVESFRNKRSDIKKPDKNIEVKGRKAKTKSFIISSNEIKKGLKHSKQKNKEHWVYFYWDIEHRKGKDPDFKPTAKIPFEELKIKQCKNCLKYLVKVNEFI